MYKLNMMIKLLISISLSLVLYACGSGSCLSNQTNTKTSGQLQFSQLESEVAVGESAQVSVALINSNGVESLVVNFSTSNNNLTLLQSSCAVSTSRPSCSISVQGTAAGSSTLSLTAAGYPVVNSGPIAVTSQPSGSVVIGNYQGLVFKNNSLVAGGESIAFLDGSAIFVDATYQDRLFAGTANANVFEYDKLTKLWRKLSLTPVTTEADDSVRSIAISNSGVIYTGTSSGWVMQYSAASESWIPVGNSKVDGSQVMSLAINSNNQLYAGTLSGSVYHYVAPDWIRVTGNGATGTLDNSSINVLALDQLQNLYAGTTDGGIYRLPVSGSTWSQIGSNLPSGISGIIATSSTSLYTSLYNGAVYQNLNSGSWNYLSSPDGFRVFSFVYGVNGIFYLSTSTGHVYKSTDNCITWQSSNIQFNFIAYVLSINNSGDLFAGTGDGSMFELPNNQNQWGVLGQGSPNHEKITALILDPQKNIYIASLGKVWGYISNTWVAKTILPLNNGAPIDVMTTDSRGSLYVASGDYTHEINCNAYKLAPDSASWELIGNGSFCSYGTAYGLVVDSAGNVYVMSQFGGVYKNDPNVAGWTSYGQLVPQSRGLIIDNQGTLLAGGGDGYVYQYSLDAGEWTKVGNNAIGTAVYSIAYDSQNNLYAGSKEGMVYKKAYNSASWILLGAASLDGSGIVSLGVDSSGNLYAGTYYGNVWRYTAGVWGYVTIGTGAPIGGMAVMP
jgi:ligand-binding sensor domain-containing protein